MSNWTPPLGAGASRWTLKRKYVVPASPSVMETSLMESEGGGALTVSAAAPFCPPAKAVIVELPEACAVAVVVCPVGGATVATAVVPEVQKKETLKTSTSGPP